MSSQHARIDLETALDMYDRRSLTAKGLVEVYFRRSIIPGTVFVKNNSEIVELLGITERTYYRVLAELRTEEVIFHSSTGKTNFALEPDTLYNQKNGKRCSTSTIGRTPDQSGSQHDQLGSQHDRLDSQHDQLDSQHDQLDSQHDQLGKTTPLKALQGEIPGTPSSLLQFSFNSSSSTYQGQAPENANPDDENKNPFLPEPEADKEGGVIDVEAKRVIEGESTRKYDYRIEIRGIEDLLKDLSGDRQEWIDFFEWADEHLWPIFKDPIQNQSKWLRSKDEDGTSRLEINWINFMSHQRHVKAPGSLNAHQAWGKTLKLASSYDRHSRLEKHVDPNDEPKLFAAIRKVGGLSLIGEASPNQLHQIKATFMAYFRAPRKIGMLIDNTLL